MQWKEKKKKDFIPKNKIHYSVLHFMAPSEKWGLIAIHKKRLFVLFHAATSTEQMVCSGGRKIEPARYMCWRSKWISRMYKVFISPKLFHPVHIKTKDGHCIFRFCNFIAQKSQWWPCFVLKLFKISKYAFNVN